MIIMSYLALDWFRRASSIGALVWLAGCHQDEPQQERPKRAMDGLERYTARTVSIETAIEAMQQRDLRKLKMLGVWVRKRDKSVLLTDDDLSSLDLAVDCLEGNRSKEEHIVELDRINSGKLKAATRELCLDESD